MNPNRKLWWFALVLLLVWDLGVHFYGAYQTEAHSKEPWIDVWFTVPAVITSALLESLNVCTSPLGIAVIVLLVTGYFKSRDRKEPTPPNLPPSPDDSN
jgi:hypothetical protein